MIAWINLGGFPAWMIVLLGAVATAVFVERWLFLHRMRIHVDDFLQGIFNVVRRRNIAEGVSLCDDADGPVARMVRAGLLKFDHGRAAVRDAMIEAGVAEIPRMEQRIDTLATAARLAPLLGMWGSVLALMQSLEILQQQTPLVHAGDLSAALWRALVCTALGLGVAAPAYAARQHLVGMVESLLVDMEDTLGKMLEQVERETARRTRPLA